MGAFIALSGLRDSVHPREPKVLDKSAFRRANNEITEGLPSGGALVCGEHWQALGYEVSRAYKRRFTDLSLLAYY